MEKINNREYQVQQMPSRHEYLKADLIARGWDGFNYLLTGKRGACYLAFRCAKTGQLSIITTVR